MKHIKPRRMQTNKMNDNGMIQVIVPEGINLLGNNVYDKITNTIKRINLRFRNISIRIDDTVNDDMIPIYFTKIIQK